MHNAAEEAAAGFPVGHAVPCEGTGYEIGSMSIIRGARILPVASFDVDEVLKRIQFERVHPATDHLRRRIVTRCAGAATFHGVVGERVGDLAEAGFGIGRQRLGVRGGSGEGDGRGERQQAGHGHGMHPVQDRHSA